MSLFARPILDLSDCPVLYPGRDQFVWISPAGEITSRAMSKLPGYLGDARPLVCHRRWSAARCGTELDGALDVLELFAFIRPGRALLPTAAGLALDCGLARPSSLADEAMTIGRAAARLLDDLDDMTGDMRQHLAGLAMMMGKGGWGWAAIVLTRLGITDSPPGPPDGRAAAVWQGMADYPDLPPRGEPGCLPVMPDKARSRLAEMLGSRAETRTSQSDYAAAAAQIFIAPEAAPLPTLLLSEAGTGTGKTLGYLAAASLWAEQNNGTVWVSTYTRTLQQQIAEELSALPDRRTEADSRHPRIVIRKGRENYLCLLNLEEALGQMPGNPPHAVGLGLMARWAAASPDGDLTGTSFPAWLVDLIGRRLTLGLADRRGECIHSACPHYHKCFVEKSVRGARQADIVVANHALVMIQAALNDPGDRRRPSRYIFDEGHHVFDAADSAFSALLSAGETAEMRSWIRGIEDGRRGRARGLKKRLGELLADDERALELLDEACERARDLPGTGWRTRLSAGQPAGLAEAFLVELRWLAYQRVTDMDSPHDIQTDLWPVPDSLAAKAASLAEMIARLQAPLRQLALMLNRTLAEQADQLDSQTRVRLEGAARGLTRRAEGPLAAWQGMLADCGNRQQQGRDGFVDWIQIDRTDGRDLDIGLRRHWLDPTIPFAETVLAPAHGVMITSATLRDASPASDTIKARDTGDQGWQMARLLSGADHLGHPALLSAHASPFDYGRQTRLFVITDLERDSPDKTAGAMAGLMQAAGGGGLGLFTAIHRLKSVWPALHARLDSAGLPLYAQHIDQMNLQTLLHLFRADRHSCLLGTDAVRDGVDVPGEALRLICYDRVPWPRPDMLYRARADWQGRQNWSEHLTRMKLRQAFGRLIRRSTDRGVFVMLDSRLPSRLADAFPDGVDIQRVGLAEAIAATRLFFDTEPGASAQPGPGLSAKSEGISGDPDA